MSTPIIAEQVRWQDLTVRSETDIVFDIAKRKGWEDCEVFGSGDMITQPQESMGWKLIPADLYKYSIPMEAVGRLHEVINAGVRVRGVIIADDERRQEPAPAPVEPEERRIEPPPAPARPRPSIRPVLSWIGKAWPGFVHAVGMGMSLVGKMIFGLFCVVSVLALAAGAISLVMLIVRSLAGFWPVVLVGLFIAIVTGAGSSGGIRVDYDPKLVILVDDGQGGTTWISLFTWYD